MQEKERIAFKSCPEGLWHLMSCDRAPSGGEVANCIRRYFMTEFVEPQTIHLKAQAT